MQLLCLWSPEQLRRCLGQACSWEWKNTSVHLLLVLSILVGATPVQIMLNLLSMNQPLNWRLNYPWPQRRDGKPWWQHQSLSLSGPNRDIVIGNNYMQSRLRRKWVLHGLLARFLLSSKGLSSILLYFQYYSIFLAMVSPKTSDVCRSSVRSIRRDSNFLHFCFIKLFWRSLYM